MRNNEIQDLIKFVSKTGVTEVQIETEKIKLVIKNEPNGSKNVAFRSDVNPGFYPVQPIAAPVASVAPSAAPAVNAAPVATPSAANDKPKEDTSKYIEVKSPMIGTLYRKPSPDKDFFVSVGDEIKVGDVLCVIEAMKLFNEIESEVSGKIVKILIDDATPVEYDQVLFLVDPS
jgi:acetyl-CoA carboxylase biotin carboxyl carrier protein